MQAGRTAYRIMQQYAARRGADRVRDEVGCSLIEPAISCGHQA
jgi:hypothetical protein